MKSGERSTIQEERARVKIEKTGFFKAQEGQSSRKDSYRMITRNENVEVEDAEVQTRGRKTAEHSNR